MKKGYKFKDGEVLAKNSSFFMDDEDASLSLGRLTKIAMCSSDATYEDSAFISDGFADAIEKRLLQAGVEQSVAEYEEFEDDDTDEFDRM